MSDSRTEARRVAVGQEPSALQSVDDRMIGMVRLGLALAALIIIYIDPSEPDKHVEVTYGALVLYTLYSAALYALSLRRARPRPRRLTHWVDVACYVALVSLSSGTNSVFFFFFFFAVIIASFRFGFREGMKVTLASGALFSAVGYATAGAEFEMNRFLLRPVYLLALGYMTAYWGGCEIKLNRQLGLLRGVTRLSNPRFDVGYTIGSMLGKLRDFYDADDCLIVLSDPRDNEYRLFRLGREQPAESVQAELLPGRLAHLFLTLPEDCAVVHRGKSRLRLLMDSGYYSVSTSKRGECGEDLEGEAEHLAARLEADCFISVPLHYRERSIGRLYMTGPRGVFEGADIAYMMQVAGQIMPVIHNIRLLERLASDAAEQERRRLARDIHDSVIQPYIGLQYKLAAVRNKVAEGRDLGDDIDRLFQTTVDEIAGLRGFVRGLRGGGSGGEGFVAGVRRFAAQFAQNYDLDVKVESKGDFRVNDRLAAEIIRIVHEGLSNVRKHTSASGAKVTLERADSSLRVVVENDGPRPGEEEDGEGAAGAAPFRPRSMTERAEELGGYVAVERAPDGRTLVKVEIPL